MWHPVLQIALENLRISQIRQKSYSIVLFCGFMWHLSGVSSSDACAMLSKWDRTLNSGVFLSSLTLPVFSLYPAQMSTEQKGLGDRAMGDSVHATVLWSSWWWYKISPRKQHTTRRMVRRLARVANFTAFLVVKFVQLKMKLQLGGTRGCSPVQRERGLIKSS